MKTILGGYTEGLIEYIPLQQGLRLASHFSISPLKSLIEYIPLQQGLRQNENHLTKF